MPCPKSKYRNKFEQSNHQALQKMAEMNAYLPSRRKDTDGQEELPASTTITTIESSAKARPTGKEKTMATTTTVTKESKELIMKNEEWPEEDSDKEMEQEMVKLQIELETEKVERLKRAELKRTEDDMNFLQEVTTIEKREARLSEARRMTEEARRKVREDEEEWLRVVLLLEEPEATSTSPAPSPNLTAKMPTGEEPFWSMGMNYVLEKKGDRMPGSKEGVGSQSIQAGTAPSLPTINLMPPSRIARPVEEQSHSPAMVKHPAVIPSPMDMATTTMDVQEHNMKKEHSLKPSNAEISRLKLEKQRREKRLLRMSSSRNLTPAVKAPEPSQGANPKVSKLVSRFETSASPIKMPRPPPTSTTGCWTSTRSPISQPTNRTLSPCTEPQLQTDQCQGQEVSLNRK